MDVTDDIFENSQPDIDQYSDDSYISDDERNTYNVNENNFSECGSSNLVDADFDESKSSKRKKNTEVNKTFSNYQLREIAQDNNVLRKKVLAHSVRPTQYKTTFFVPKVTSAEINRRKFQREIDRKNLVSLTTLFI